MAHWAAKSAAGNHQFIHRNAGEGTQPEFSGDAEFD